MSERFGRWQILFVQYLRRDWKKIIVWILGLGLFSAGLVPAFQELAKGEGRSGMYETLSNPAMISIVGPTPAKTAADYTLGAMYAHEMLLFCGLCAMTVAMLHVVGHTRKEEDLGLTELIRSFQIGRHASSLAIMTEIVVINIVLAILITLVLSGFQAETITLEGSFLFGASVAMAGIMGGAIALVMAQLMPVSSAATGSSLGIMGLFYIMRGGTDIANLKLSMANPLGWTYLTYPMTENNWLPICFAALFSLVAVLGGFTLEGARDMGAGYLPEKEGKAEAKRSLLSVPGLFIRLNRGIIISWLLAFVILGAAYGAVFQDMGSFLESNEMMKQMFTYAGFTIEESFTSTIMMVMIGLVTILPIAVVNKLFTEERNLYLSQIHGTKVRRSELYWTSLLLAVSSSFAGVILAGAGLGLSALIVMENGAMQLGDFLLIGLSFFPAVLFFTALAGLALGWRPELGRLIYVYLTYSFFLNYFEELLKVPNWLAKTAPQSWLSKMPLQDFDLRLFVMLTLVSLSLMILGYLGYSRRDLVEGA